nr:prepilin-type N-terminal cleavage/methylation domain-containing protein [Rhodoferax sp.]
MKTFNKQGGFTLVEVTTVLVIGGLILGGAMKGQELIEAGRIKSAVAQLTSIAVAHSAYVERYQALAGDDKTADTRGAAWAGTKAGDADGVIEGVLTDTFAVTSTATSGTETAAFFQHLRMAGFLSGDLTATGAAVLPVNAWGGRTAIANTTQIQGRSSASNQLVVCLSSVPEQSALSIDKQLDDGLAHGGNLRATSGTDRYAQTAPTTGTTTYANTGGFYTICRDL